MVDKSINEIWKPIINYEGFYEISNLNEVKRLAGYRCSKERILIPRKNKNGYLYMSLYKSNNRKLFSIHQLMLEAFIGLCPPGMVCRHLDGNKLNNKIENLVWGTRSDNEQDKKFHGTYQFGSKNPGAKLNEKQVRIIKYLLRTNYLTQKDIAKIFHVNHRTISYIKLKKLWCHVG